MRVCTCKLQSCRESCLRTQNEKQRIARQSFRVLERTLANEGLELMLHQSHDKCACEGPFQRKKRVNKNILCVKKKMKKPTRPMGTRGKQWKEIWVLESTRPRLEFRHLVSCVTVNQFLNLSEPQLSHLQNGDKTTCLTEPL